MIGINTDMFFDRAKVIAAIEKGTESTESKAGAFIMTRARSSIRPRKRSATPGSPPSSHVGDLRNRIFFGYDTHTKTTVIGPQLYRSNNPTIPHVLEFGGTLRSYKGTDLKYHAFPFMAPALAAEADKFPGLFAGAVKG
jgi:hypothetical protein